MNSRFDFASDAFTPAEVVALKELADVLWDQRRDIAAEWSRRLMQRLPEYFPEDAPPLEYLTDVNEAFLTLVLQQLQEGDLAGLHITYYQANWNLIQSDLARAPAAPISLESLYASAHVSLTVINEHLLGAGDRFALVYTKLAAQLMMLVGRAYSDCREEHLQRSFEQIQTLSRLFRDLLESAPDAMVIVNQQGEIVLINSQTEALFGYRRDELMHQPVEILVPERFRANHPQHRTQYFDGPSARPMGTVLELVGRRKDGSEFPVEISLSPLQTTDGVLVTSGIRDITDRKRAEEEVHRLNADLERRVHERTAELARSNRELEQFAYVASHDLQEPLRAVARYTQLLTRRYASKLDDDGQHFIERTTAAVVRMRTLIEDLLEYSRVGTRGAELQPTACESVLQSVLENLHATIEETGALVSHDPLPVLVADASQMRQLFQNLIGNAIKFHSAAPPRVHVSARDTGQHWLFTVRDNGIGLDPTYEDRIFVIFQRLHSYGAYPGTGVGLAICRKIVERYGGRIWVESQPGAGATFFFTLARNGG